MEGEGDDVVAVVGADEVDADHVQILVKLHVVQVLAGEDLVFVGDAFLQQGEQKVIGQGHNVRDPALGACPGEGEVVTQQLEYVELEISDWMIGFQQLDVTQDNVCLLYTSFCFNSSVTNSAFFICSTIKLYLPCACAFMSAR